MNDSGPLDKKQRLYAEQVRQLYKQAPIGLASIPIIALIMVVLLWAVTPHWILITWYSAVLLVAAPRYWLVVKFSRSSQAPAEADRWRTGFIIGTALSGIVWGTASLFLFPLNSVAHQFLIALMLGGMVAGAAGTYSVIMGAFFVYSLPALIPLAIRFFLFADGFSIGVGLVVLVFEFLMVVNAKRVNAAIVSSLEMRFENRDLVETLAVEKERLEKLNTEYADEIIQRKRAEETLRESEERYRDLFENTSDLIQSVTLDGTVIYVNRAWREMLGYSEEEIPGLSLFGIIHPDSQAHCMEMFQRVMNGETLDRVEAMFVTKGGRTVMVEGNVSCKFKDGDPIATRGIFRDITERKRAEEALAQVHDQALEASRLKGRLLANVSHDLRSPLGAILGFTEMLQEGVYGPLSEQQHTAMTEIADSTEQLLIFVNNLLGQAQIESGKVVLHIKPFTPDDLLATISSTTRVVAQFKGLKLIGEVAPDTPVTLSGDLYWLRRIVVNLVGNAVKFTDQGTVKMRVYQADENYWAIQVSDTGRGIPAEAQSYIFDPFRQADETVTSQYQAGSGLGLSIVKQLTALMGGRVTLTSEVGQGSTFTVLLPLKPIQEETV